MPTVSRREGQLIPARPSATVLRQKELIPADIAASMGPNTLLIEFDNDIFTGTDYYYTNGIAIGFSGPALSFLGKSKILPGLGKEAQDIFSVKLTQKMYTGLNPETEVPPVGDHPFSGLLFTGFTRSSTAPKRGLMMHSTFVIGLTGKASLASGLQRTVHELQPSGWDFQTASGLLLNYNLALEKRITNWTSGSISLGSMARAGNLETSASVFFAFNQNFSGSATGWRSLHLFATLYAHKVWHKASLRGSLWKAERQYVVPYQQLERNVGELNVGLSYWQGRTGFGFKVVYLSAEFQGGRPHKWGGIQLTREL
ncbi:MAG: lipid A deacylase LpxR family protein [Bacteroidetes bacterium]|nr:lipid A deacylase LpxR family protein [Bacteroidota bacterium]